MGLRYKKESNEEARILCSQQKIYLFLGGENGFKHKTSFFNKMRINTLNLLKVWKFRNFCVI